MRKLTILILLLAVAGVVAGLQPPTGARAGPVGKMYWTVVGDPAEIQRANLNGTGVENLVTTGPGAPKGIALDVDGGKMYWPDAVTAKIQRANLNGTGVENLVTTGLGSPVDIALDVGGGKMYWTDDVASKIQRANLNGTGVEDLVTGLAGPEGIALDVKGGKMYWTDASANKIQRAGMEIPDGETPSNRTDVEDLVTVGLMDAVGIALDVGWGKMYWTDEGTAKIQRANLDGSKVEDLVTGLSYPWGIALDVARGKMYWVDVIAAKIQRAGMEIPDGETPSNRTDVEDVVTELSAPVGIALDLPSVGGIAELPEVAGTPLEAPESSGLRMGVLAGIAAAVAAGAVALGGAAWWVRRKRV